MFRDSHHVSVKIALFSADLERVLLMHYPKMDAVGLPGGHIDKGETPDEALVREMHEELGVTLGLDSIKRVDFFYSKRIILGYIGVVPNDFETFPSDPKYEYAVWHTKDEIASLDTFSKDYEKFVLEHWPVA